MLRGGSRNYVERQVLRIMLRALRDTMRGELLNTLSGELEMYRDVSLNCVERRAQISIERWVHNRRYAHIHFMSIFITVTRKHGVFLPQILEIIDNQTRNKVHPLRFQKYLANVRRKHLEPTVVNSASTCTLIDCATTSTVQYCLLLCLLLCFLQCLP